MKGNNIRRPVGVTVIAWLLIVSGGLHAANEILGRLWNVIFGEQTRTFIVVGAPIGTQVLLFGSILLGIGMLRLSRVAYVFVCIIGALFLVGAALWLVDSVKEHDSIQLGIALTATFSSLVILVYLGRKTLRSKFFTS